MGKKTPTETGLDMANSTLTTSLTLRWPLLVENMEIVMPYLAPTGTSGDGWGFGYGSTTGSGTAPTSTVGMGNYYGEVDTGDGRGIGVADGGY